MDRLDVLKTFIAVADRRSFVEAARHLRISPAAASRAIAVLEADLGVAVFHRTTRAVALTDEGAAYLERCRHALSELEDAARAVQGGSAEPRGALAITAPVVFGRMHITPLITELLRAHPALNLRLTLTDRNVHVIEEGIDVAVRIGELADSTLLGLQLAEVRRVVVASPDYLAASGTPVTPAALQDHSLIAIDSLTPNGDWRFENTRARAIRLEPRLLTNDIATGVEAAVRGLGIARLLSYQVADHIAAGRLSLILEDFAPAPVPVTALYSANRRRSANVIAFIKAARAYFNSPGWHLSAG